jgi:hypothetical protein
MTNVSRACSIAFFACALGCGGESAVRSGSSSGASGGSGARGGSSDAGGDGGAEAQGGGTGGSTGAAGNGNAGGNGAASGGAGNAGANGASGEGGDAGAPAEMGGEGGTKGVSPGPLSGNWGMFHFEDPVSVTFEQDGEVLSGTGCCAGLGGDELLQCCGPLSGNVAEPRATFAFVFDAFSGGRVYGTDVTVSADRQRMGGTFSIDGEGSLKVAWVRFEGSGIAQAPDSLSQTLQPRAGAYELRLYSAFAGRFDPLEPLTIRIAGHGFVASDFGPFYWGEMSWNAGTEVLTLGPVPATDPSFATQLDLEFVGDLLERVVAHYPDEPPYLFDAQAAP